MPKGPEAAARVRMNSSGEAQIVENFENASSEI
jgi:hypothetical protein